MKLRYSFKGSFFNEAEVDKYKETDIIIKCNLIANMKIWPDGRVIQNYQKGKTV